jgi:hypothetical protein
MMRVGREAGLFPAAGFFLRAVHKLDDNLTALPYKIAQIALKSCVFLFLAFSPFFYWQKDLTLACSGTIVLFKIRNVKCPTACLPKIENYDQAYIA